MRWIARHQIHVVDLGHLPEPHGYCTDSWRQAIDGQLWQARDIDWIEIGYDIFF